MIDLRTKGLPDCIEHEGRPYGLKTDFREWIEFDHILQEHGMVSSHVFADEIPTDPGAVEPLMEFYLSPNVTPRSHHDGPRTVDMVLDGDYIVASFMQAYDVDLTQVEYMHWHVFKALLYGLPDSTVMGRIMGYRSYRKPPRGERHETVMMRLRRDYELPRRGELEERAKLLQWAEEMGL